MYVIQSLLYYAFMHNEYVVKDPPKKLCSNNHFYQKLCSNNHFYHPFVCMMATIYSTKINIDFAQAFVILKTFNPRGLFALRPFFPKALLPQAFNLKGQVAQAFLSQAFLPQGLVAPGLIFFLARSRLTLKVVRLE